MVAMSEGVAAALVASMKPKHESGIAEMPFSRLTMDRCILYRITRHSNDKTSGIFALVDTKDHGLSFRLDKIRSFLRNIRLEKFACLKYAGWCNILIILYNCS